MHPQFRTKDHPEANGRTPESGDAQYVFTFPLEDGTWIEIAMGQAGFDTHSQQILDVLSGTPSYGDGSVPGMP